MNVPTVTDSDDESAYPFEELNPFDVPIATPFFDDHESGDGIDDSPLRQHAEAPPPPRDAKATVPSIDEWLDFFSRIVLRVACDWYIEWAFRGVDESILNDREIARIQMTDEERKRIAVPFAEISHKSKFMRKHGRAIVASGGVFDAIVALGVWTSRVNRIARKYKTPTLKGKVVNERAGPSEQATSGPGFRDSGANGGSVGATWRVANPGSG